VENIYDFIGFIAKMIKEIFFLILGTKMIIYEFRIVNNKGINNIM